MNTFLREIEVQETLEAPGRAERVDPMLEDKKDESPKRPGSIRPVPCDSCGGTDFRPLFEKASERDEVFRIVSCKQCSLVQVNPQPDLEAVRPYYEESYFTKRTDRGYANYYSPELKEQIRKVYDMNLRDLGFFEYEKQAMEAARAEGDAPLALDAGCAAGYFVEHVRSRGWRSKGVEISQAAARFGREELGLDIIVDDYLSTDLLQPDSFDLISLWASIEHMHSPRRVLERTRDLLKPGGRMLLSTCRYGILARWKGPEWRYMNVPEHLYFFSLNGLIKAARAAGLALVDHVTYGSGMTTRADAGPGYRIAKRIADPLVKHTGQGDMMALHLMKV